LNQKTKKKFYIKRLIIYELLTLFILGEGDLNLCFLTGGCATTAFFLLARKK